MPPGMFPHDQAVPANANGLRGHDLVGDLFLEDSVLMDARLMCKGVVAHDGLIDGDGDPGNLGQQAGGGIDLLSDHMGVHTKQSFSCLKGHHHFFQRGIARAFSNTVDRALHLPGPIRHGSQRVGHRQPQIVMTMGAPGDLIRALRMVYEVTHQRAKL